MERHSTFASHVQNEFETRRVIIGYSELLKKLSRLVDILAPVPACKRIDHEAAGNCSLRRVASDNETFTGNRDDRTFDAELNEILTARLDLALVVQDLNAREGFYGP